MPQLKDLMEQPFAAQIVGLALVGVAAAGGPAEVTGRIVELGQSWRLDAFAFTGWFGGDFPAFNLADTWITVGVVFVGWRILFERKPAPTEGEAASPGAAS